jgi:hypothetical protein
MRRLYLIGTACLLLGLLLSGCGPAPAATPQPAATPVPATPTPAPPADTPIPPTATGEPTATPTPEPTTTPAPDLSLPADWVVFADDERGLRIHHPALWDVTSPTGDNLAELFAQATGDESESIRTILHQLTEAPDALDAFAVLGFLFDDPTIANNRFVSNFTGIVVPAEGLTLETYMNLVSVQLGSVEAITVQSVQVAGGLRPGGLDVASLRYTIDGATLYGLTDGTQIDGWQIALYDTRGERLLILSLTGAAENFPPLEEMFQRLVYHTEFE